MQGVIDAILKHIGAGGPAVAWALVAYLLLRLHQLTDRQHEANLKTVEALTVIKTLLVAKLGGGSVE